MLRACLTASIPIALILLFTACQPPVTATVASSASVAHEHSLAAIRLPSIPKAAPVSLQRGQRLVLPNRTPIDNWQLDYDPRYWQRAEGDPSALIAIAAGETDVVQRERPEHGGPAPRRFVYRVHISP
ncbi:MAG TPA: hypothetical protein VFV64_08165 [Permianibacter sp.]|nr:hypothetical protein [Permianibacter sp.]